MSDNEENEDEFDLTEVDALYERLISYETDSSNDGLDRRTVGHERQRLHAARFGHPITSERMAHIRAVARDAASVLGMYERHGVRQ